MNDETAAGVSAKSDGYDNEKFWRVWQRLFKRYNHVFMAGSGDEFENCTTAEKERVDKSAGNQQRNA